MKTEKISMYHIAFYPEPESEILHCINIEANNMQVALNKFYAKFPDIEPLYIHHKK
jgi:hypothetical protein